jgi:hypothetical protein
VSPVRLGGSNEESDPQRPDPNHRAAHISLCGLNFTTKFAFYAGNTKIPAGSYKITASNLDEAILLIEDSTGAHSAYLDFTPTQAASGHAASDVTFKKYGNVDFLSRCWARGQQFGMLMEPTKYEKKLAASGQPQEHSVSAK